METHPIEEHVCVAHKYEWKVTIICSCQARWTVTQAEYDAKIDHIEDHRRYANRPLMKAD
jgi:hypothetical protein